MNLPSLFALEDALDVLPAILLKSRLACQVGGAAWRLKAAVGIAVAASRIKWSFGF
jgi:hypothetical protein